MILRLFILVLITLGSVSSVHADVPDTSLSNTIALDKKFRSALSHWKLETLMRASEGGNENLYTINYLAALPAPKGGKQWACLAEALYFEARGEEVKGQFAVAEVILNRVDSASFPSFPCGVVHQGTGRRFACQFTYDCDGRAEVIRDQKAYIQVGKVAQIMLEGAPRRLTKGALYYHTKSVNPKWARSFSKTVTIGSHYFYVPPQKIAKNN
ncbi:cell wall hydrolase [Rhodobacteraceae bacterium nBUS_24]